MTGKYKFKSGKDRNFPQDKQGLRAKVDDFLCKYYGIDKEELYSLTAKELALLAKKRNNDDRTEK